MIVVPEYYKKFKCIADRCKHNCCIGWEIDIDNDTMDYYSRLNGNMGKKLSENIKYSDDLPHFILDENERCPFLNVSGLCEIISELGEEALCNICTDHPRFRNFYSGFTEMGLGLCCEEAARIILSETEPFSVSTPKNALIGEDEEFVLNFRDTLFEILQKREISIGERFTLINCRLGFDDFAHDELCNIYFSLERLDSSWTELLEELRSYSFKEAIFNYEKFQIPFEQLACYFIFRHFSEAIWDGELEKRSRFALAGCYLVGALCEWHAEKYGDVTLEDMSEFARMYSAEVEYSEENINALLSAM